MIKDILKRTAYVLLVAILVVTSVPIPISASSQTVLDGGQGDGTHGDGSGDDGTK